MNIMLKFVRTTSKSVSLRKSTTLIGCGMIAWRIQVTQVHCDNFQSPNVHAPFLVSPTLSHHLQSQDIKSWIKNIVSSMFRGSKILLQFLRALLGFPIYCSGLIQNDKWWWDLLRESLCNSGPCYIKLAQWIATRPDIFSTKICSEMELLQTKAATHTWLHTIELLQKKYGENWNAFIQVNSNDIIGCGCIAQVYRAKIKIPPQIANIHHDKSIDQSSEYNNSSQWKDIVIKVQHPNIKYEIESDIKLLYNVACIAEYILGLWDRKAAKCLSLVEGIEEFSLFMETQIDFNKEKYALQKFHTNFSKSSMSKQVSFPIPIEIQGYWQRSGGDIRISHGSDSGGILMMTYERGIAMSDVLDFADNLSIERRREIALIGINAMLKMVRYIYSR